MSGLDNRILRYPGDRGTGKTTRCVESAMRAALDGHRVLVISHSNESARWVCRLIAEKFVAQKIECEKSDIVNRVSVKTGGTILCIGQGRLGEMLGMAFEQIHVDTFPNHILDSSLIHLLRPS